ncbi:MAG: hypothetical protein HY782_13460 [Chloroflexi bacterium]|nr:hypothetical protein [Chloroflexota bacterium]
MVAWFGVGSSFQGSHLDGDAQPVGVQAPSSAVQIVAVTLAPAALKSGELLNVSITVKKTSLNAGGLLNVSITVKNNSNVPLATQDPQPGFVYEEGETFYTRGFPDVQSAFRVGIDFDGRTGIDHPYRWGWGAPLAPGETRTITGAIRMKQPQSRSYWVGLVQERVAWLQDREGTQLVNVVSAGTVTPPTATAVPKTATATPTNAGKPQIIAVTLAPTSLNAGGLLNVSITVKNNSNVPLATQDPQPGFVYEEGETSYTRGFPDVHGAFRVGIDFDGRTGVDHPYRWGLGTPLAPGETRTIAGAIRMKQAQSRSYWVGLVQERVAWLQDQLGAQTIRVEGPTATATATAMPKSATPTLTATAVPKTATPTATAIPKTATATPTIPTATPTNVGKPQIVAVTLAPTSLKSGELLNVSITVKNNSSTPLISQDPPPGLVYEEDETFYTRGYPDVYGAFRVGIEFGGRTGIDHPYRWGWGAPLAPGETRTITGAIRMKQAQSRSYWVGLVQERVAWLQDQLGAQTIRVEGPTATPTPTRTNTPVPGWTSTPIPMSYYGTLAVLSPPTDRPAAQHADLNLALRSYAPVGAWLGLVDYWGGTDPGAPQLYGVFADQRTPQFNAAYRVYDWNWECNCRGALMNDWDVMLLGFQANPNETVHVPGRSGTMANGYHALVLYADADRVTLKYTPDDNVIWGYTIHLEGIATEPSLISLYESLNSIGRQRLPAVRGGQIVGRARGTEVKVAIRDTGAFLDPRSRKDWWQGR